MNDQILKILSDLYQIDPDLKNNEKELVEIIKRLMENKPEVRIDEQFSKILREQLEKESRGKNKVIKFPHSRKLLLAAIVSTLAVTFLIMPIFFTSNTPKNETVVLSFGGEKEEGRMTNRITESSDEDFLSSGFAPSPVSKDFSQKIDQKGDINEPEERANEPDWNTEEYDRIHENQFLDAIKNPVSTFSIDVDTASYANVRRFLQNGSMPYPDSVRIEELVNYFTYDYPEPTDDDPFSFTSEITDCPWNTKNLLLKIGLQGKNITFENLPPNNLVFLLDVSGSMNTSAKLPLLKSALKLVVNNMREIDTISIVVYAGAAGTVLEPTSGLEKYKIIEALDRLEAGGGTAGAEGIRLAYEKAFENYDSKGNNRIIIATDGDFNVGVSSDAELERLIENKRNNGVFLTVLGFGMGNYKDSKMEKIADTGNGNYAYIDTISEAKKVLVEQMGGTFFTIAKDVKIQIEFNPTHATAYRLIGYENRILSREDFDDDTKDAGELGAGHSVTALYEIVPASEVLAENDLKYQTTTVNQEAFFSEELMTIKFRYKNPDSDKSKLIEVPVMDYRQDFNSVSDDFRFAAAVAQWGMLLRDSEYKGSSTYNLVIKIATNAKGDDYEGYRDEFLKLVKLSRELSE